jgi:hypothetical protein
MKETLIITKLNGENIRINNMKNLKEYIAEGIFDVDNNIDNIDKSMKDQIKQFLKDNLKGASACKISRKPNADGKYEVSCNGGITVINKKITSLTNGMFIWTIVKGNFDCTWCESLISLEGGPKEVGGDFDCRFCDSLTSLEGAPEKVGGKFSCDSCHSLTSLAGTSKEIRGSLSCNSCSSLTSLEGAPKEVGGCFDCRLCHSLTSLEGAPKKVGRSFFACGCKIEFTKEDVEKVSDVKGNIIVSKWN